MSPLVPRENSWAKTSDERIPNHYSSRYPYYPQNQINRNQLNSEIYPLKPPSLPMHIQLSPNAIAAGKGVLIGLASAFGSAAFVGLVFYIIYFLKYTAHGRIILDRLGRPGEFDDEQALLREEAEALENMDEISRQEYLRAKAFIEANPPDSVPTDISLSQFLAIQEKGVSAWEFEAELEIANCFVEARTEIEFFDSVCSVQSNLPVPKQNEVYYWEAKLFDKPEGTLVAIGMSTKPYPMFRLPGWHKHSIAYVSNGERKHNQPFSGTPYGPQFHQGDVIGVGYRPRTGTIFFTRNGKKLDDVAHGLKSLNLFPTVGANGPCTVHVNFGQLGFVFIEANVKKWGLAPASGSLAPPPPYGSEQGTLLLAAGGPQSAQQYYDEYQRLHAHRTHARSRSANLAYLQGTSQPGRAQTNAHPPRSPGPIRSPTEISLAPINVGAPSVARAIEGSSPLGPPPEYSSPTSSRRNSSEESQRSADATQESQPLLGPAPPYEGSSVGDGRDTSGR